MTMPPALPVVTLYTKPGCGLCDDAEEIIQIVRQKSHFELRRKSILDDLTDYERFKHDIPVVFLNGREIARHRIAEAQLARALSDGNHGVEMGGA